MFFHHFFATGLPEYGFSAQLMVQIVNQEK
jgi:hypothetical protein